MGDQATPPVTGYPAPAGAPPTNSNGYYSNRPPPSGTAYAYAAPPPRAYNYNYNNYNPYYQQPDADAVRRAVFLRRVFAVIIALFIIIGVVFFIIWLVLRPRIPEFRADSLSVSNFNLSNNLVTANWEFQFTARNPNKKISLDYQHIYAEIFYDDESLAETSVAPFYQDSRNETTSKAEFAAKGAFVEDWVVERINKERPDIVFKVWMLARVSFKAGSWRTRSRYLRVFCGGLTVGFSRNSSSGNLVGAPRQCRSGL
nr:protein YLS9-like [Ipomoea trifida]GME11223.1 protein YLS9-like [Ipomoea batatas]